MGDRVELDDETRDALMRALVHRDVSIRGLADDIGVPESSLRNHLHGRRPWPKPVFEAVVRRLNDLGPILDPVLLAAPAVIPLLPSRPPSAIHTMKVDTLVVRFPQPDPALVVTQPDGRTVPAADAIVALVEAAMREPAERYRRAHKCRRGASARRRDDERGLMAAWDPWNDDSTFWLQVQFCPHDDSHRVLINAIRWIMGDVVPSVSRMDLALGLHGPPQRWLASVKGARTFEFLASQKDEHVRWTSSYGARASEHFHTLYDPDFRTGRPPTQAWAEWRHNIFPALRGDELWRRPPPRGSKFHLAWVGTMVGWERYMVEAAQRHGVHRVRHGLCGEDRRRFVTLLARLRGEVFHVDFSHECREWWPWIQELLRCILTGSAEAPVGWR